MKKNYLSKTAMSANPLAMIVAKKSWQHTATTWLLLLFTVFGFTDALGQTTDTFTTTGAGTWTAPCGVTSVTVEAWGAGGSGGGTTADNSKGGGGGAGGTFVSSTITVVPGTTYNLFVAPQTNGANSAGVKGQGSWFINNTTLFAEGGNGGAAPNNGTVAGGTGSITSSIGTVRTAGANGANGTTLLGGAGGAGSTGGGAGGNQRNTEGDGQNGNAIGGGGGGAYIPDNTNHNGGNGARGEVRITYTSPFATYCAPTFTTGVEPITNVTFAGINNTTSNVVGGTPQLQSFCDIASVQQGSSYPISIKGNTDGNFTDYLRVYIDWDQNGVFGNVANEIYDIGTITNSTGVDAITLNGTIAVPAGALLGNTRMRVMKRYNGYPSGPCQTGAGYGQTEDYTVNISALLPCVTPTTQPTALGLTPASTTIAGSFTAAIPAPNNYLVVVSTSATPPSPVNGTTYTIGGTVGAGYTVVDTDSNTTFTATGLTPSTLYYVYVFSYNSACTGGPIYYTTSPLSGSTTTLSVTYCSPTSWDPDGLYISSVAFVGALTDPPVNSSTFNATGFQNFTTLPVKAIQAQGEGINIVARSNGTVHTRGTWKAWVDWNKNGTFQPATEEVYNIQGFAGADATFGFVIPPATPPGDYRIRIRVNNGTDTFWGDETFGFDFLPCDDFEEFAPYDSWIEDYGETEDYLFTVVTKCNSLITTVTNGSRCDAGTVTLGATATAGVTEFRWYTVATGGAYVTSTPSGTSTTYTPTIAATTNYYVTAWNGSCESQVRTLVVAKMNPTPVVSFTPASPVICGENSIISLTATGDTEITHLINENFEGAGLGVFSNINNDTNGPLVDAITSWKNQTSTFVPTTTNVWFPAVSSGFGTNKFALAYSDSDPTPTNTIENSIALTTAVSSNTFLNLTLKLKLYYSRYFPDAYIDATADEYVRIELSTDGGTTYPILLEEFTSDVGIGTRFAELSYDLSAYINQPNLKIRVRHRSYAGTGWLPDGVAIDNVELFGTKPLNTAFNYNTATVDAFTNPGATIPYVSGSPATTIYIKPTLTQLENASFSIPVTATLSNGCSATGSVTVTNNTKMFVAGTTGTDWNTATNWKPNGVPTANNCVVIFDNDVNITGTNYTGYGLNLTVKPSGNLNIASSNSSIITDIVNVEAGGVLEIENDASLVQINNVTNTGNIVYKRTAPSIRGFDYVYWSSPVANQNIGTIYTSPVSGLKYQWNPTIANGNGGQGNWETASGNMVRAKGYIVRGSSNYGMSATNIDATFTGVPHNGNIPFTISRGSYTGVPYNGTNGIQITNINDNYNLLGNPYPSAIDAQEFLAANTYHVTTNPTGVIYGNVKLWTHGYQPASIVNPFYGTFTYNYNANDYVTLNYLGASDPIGASNIIKSGQAFLVQMIDGTAGSGTINFSNGMRLDASNNSYNNSGFFRTSTNEFEKHRIWLDLIDANNIASGTLVGYATDATYGFDTFFDAQAAVPGFMKIYSLIGNDVYDIQGRSLPFDQNDQVPLGATFVQAGNYTIALNTIDGIFLDSTQNIFLEDKLTNNIHNLKTTPYSFTASVGTFHDRFVLRYTNTVLGNENFENNNNVTVFTNANININSSVETIRSVQIFDLLGRDIAKFDNINNRSFTIQNVKPTQSALLVKVTLSNGTVVSKKTIY